jgi:hypothetical protein
MAYKILIMIPQGKKEFGESLTQTESKIKGFLRAVGTKTYMWQYSHNMVTIGSRKQLGPLNVKDE